MYNCTWLQKCPQLIQFGTLWDPSGATLVVSSPCIWTNHAHFLIRRCSYPTVMVWNFLFLHRSQSLQHFINFFWFHFLANSWVWSLLDLRYGVQTVNGLVHFVFCHLLVPHAEIRLQDRSPRKFRGRRANRRPDRCHGDEAGVFLFCLFPLFSTTSIITSCIANTGIFSFFY